MIRRPPRSTRTDTLFPYTTLFRSAVARAAVADLLPALIAQRRTKGGPTGFLRRVFNARADDAIRMLVDGRLIAAGVLDQEWLRRVRSERMRAEGRDNCVLAIDTGEEWVREREGRGR